MHVKSILFTASAWLFGASALLAEIPTGYYNSAEGKSAAALRTALSGIVASHTNVGYDGLWTVYETSDRTSDGKVWDMYSTCTWSFNAQKCGNYAKVCDCYNREHSVPKSWFSSKAPMYSDAFHLYPTDGKVNGQRSNYPFGECGNGSSLESRALGRLGASTFSGYTGTVFEPVDEYKGDFARSYFYMATCYRTTNFTNSGGSAVFTYTSGVCDMTPYAIALFLKWHRADPVSQKELDRNDAIYHYQHNRNPFIDHPELAEYIWGNKKGYPYSLTADVTEIVEAPVLTLHNRTLQCEYVMQVFNLMGQRVGTGSELILPQAGVYIVRVGDFCQKIAVR